jgi:hypothetical protein
MDINIKHKDRAEKNEHKQEKPYEQFGCYAGKPMPEQYSKTHLSLKS